MDERGLAVEPEPDVISPCAAAGKADYSLNNPRTDCLPIGPSALPRPHLQLLWLRLNMNMFQFFMRFDPQKMNR